MYVQCRAVQYGDAYRRTIEKMSIDFLYHVLFV